MSKRAVTGSIGAGVVLLAWGMTLPPPARWLGPAASRDRSAKWMPTSTRLPGREQPEDTIDALAAQLAAAERRSADETAPLDEREQAVDRAIDVRRRLVAGARRTDQRLAAWMNDQAAALLSRLSRDGSDSCVLFGVPLPAQRAAVERAAAEAMDLAKDSAVVAGPLIDVAAAGGPDSRRRAGALEAERSVRAPFFLGRAATLLAVCRAGAGAAEGRSLAEDAIGALTGLALTDEEAEAARRATLGGALLLRAAPGDADAALREFLWVIDAAREPKGAPPEALRIPLAEAWLGALLAAGEAGRPALIQDRFRTARTRAPFVRAGSGPDALMASLAADASARALVASWRRNGDVGSLAGAMEEELALMARRDLGLDPGGLRALVFEKIAALTDRTMPFADLPPIVTLARAVVAGREGGAADGRDEALRLLQSLADRKDAGDLCAEALWESAVILTRGGNVADRARAVGALVRLARDFPSSPRAGDAIVGAVAHARALDQDSAKSGADTTRRVRLEALAVATERYTGRPEIDSWRVEHAGLLLDAGEARERALALLEEVGPDSVSAADAQRLYVSAQNAALGSAWEALARARRAGDEQEVRRLASVEILPLARRAVAWAEPRAGSLPAPDRDRFGLNLADAQTESLSAEGQPIYKDLLARHADVPGGATRVRLGLARSQHLASDDAAAFATLRELVGPLDASSTARPDAYWHAWTIMLEILRAQNKDGSRTGVIRAHITRLESIDKELGGEPWRTRIASVRSSLPTP